MKTFLTILIVIIIIAGGFVFFKFMKKSPVHQSTAAIELQTAMRKLWEDHIVWTRNYIISALANLEDSQAVVERLLQNQVDIGDAIKPVYGKNAGDTLAALLKDHILIAAEVVTAAKSGDTAALKTSSEKWRSNANDIAKFLSSANPYWNNAMLQDMLYKHLEFTTGEVVSRLGKKWKEDIAFYDKGHEHMLMFSDMLTNGVIKQFPAKF